MHTIRDPEIKRHRAARQALVEDFRAYGIKPVVDLDFFASGLPDEEALHGLWEHVQELAKRSSRSPAAACDALNHVMLARDTYDLEVRGQRARQIRLSCDLMAFARKRTAHEIIALLDRRAADPERGPSVLVALWEGAVAAKLARDTDEEDQANLGVINRGNWNSVPGDSEAGLRCLAEDPVAFAAAARKALSRENKPFPQDENKSDENKLFPRDWLRPLRDLVQRPTRRKFEALVKQGDDHNEQKVFLPVLRRTGRRLFGGKAMTWRRQDIGGSAPKIKAVARGALQFLKSSTEASSPPRDRAQDAYVTRLCEIFRDLTENVVSYSTAWPSSKLRPEGSRFGPALTFVQLGLRLIDTGASQHQARACIDWYRGRLPSG